MRLKLTLDLSGLVSVLCPRIGISSCVWIEFTLYLLLFFFSFLLICWQNGVMRLQMQSRLITQVVALAQIAQSQCNNMKLAAPKMRVKST